jgi:multiple sugar transport system substrate-binding protein
MTMDRPADVIRRCARLRSSLVLTAFLVCTGCSGDTRTGAAGAQVRLTYWSSQNPQELSLARRLVDSWNAEHPDIHVTVQPLPAGQSSEEVLLAAVAAGTTPDVCSNIWPGIVSDFVRAGGVLALDSFPDFDSLFQSRIPESLQERFRAEDGHVYQIPWKSNPIMMQYNVRLFRDAGFETPPRTYSEFLRAADRITMDLDGDGSADRWIGYRNIRPIWHQRYFDYYSFYVGASGGRALFTDGELTIDTTASSRVFGFFRDLYDRGHFPRTQFQGNMFIPGIIATEFVGPWNIAFLERNAPADLEYAFAPLPVPDDHEGPVFTYGDYKNIAVFSNTPHPAEAWMFAKYLVSKEADSLLMEMATQIPIRRDLLTDSTFAAVFERSPRMRAFAAQVEETVGIEEVGSFAEMMDAIAQQFEAAAVYGVRSPAEATRRAVERIHVIQEWNR